MPFDRLTAYLRLSPSSALALVDAIVCMADAEEFYDGNLLQTALRLASDVRSLPESCAMRDGRKWKSIPFLIFSNALGSSRMIDFARYQEKAAVYPVTEPSAAIAAIQAVVDKYHDEVLADYRNLGILIRFDKGRVQIGPAMQRRNGHVESEFYYSPADRRKNSGWVTIRRDKEGLRQDVELFQLLLERGASETEMQAFFEEHPAILMEARAGIPISHSPNFARPRNNKPDFAFSPILGPEVESRLELLELKGPTERILNRGDHRGFAARVTYAINQVRDYERYMRDASNFQATLRAFGYLPEKTNRAVLIGRAPTRDEDIEIWRLRKREVDVTVVTYDEILQTQANQVRGPYNLQYGTAEHPLD
jgi:Shedu protein SduA, C-terminal